VTGVEGDVATEAVDVLGEAVGAGEGGSDGGEGKEEENNTMDAFFDDDIDFKGMQKGLSPRNSMHMKRKLTHAITGLSMGE
jgi:hypothetical protein